MRTLFATSLVLSLFTLTLPAQQVPKVNSALPKVRRPVLAGEDGNPVQGVRLARAQVKAVVHGNLAQTTMTLTFANDLPRVLGGNLVFPLPEGATVTGYGLEMNGQIVDGVAVGKERARVIYESEIHKRVDPGLVENVEGNAFRTRLYPIPANGTRSIKIEYVTQIEQLKDGPSLALPMGFGEALDELSIRLEMPEATAAPAVKAGGIDGLSFAKAERGFVAEASAKKAKCGDELVIALPELAQRSVAVEKRAKFPRTIEELEGPHQIDHLQRAGFGDFEHYFVVTDSPTAAERNAVQLKNHRVGVVWDASLSRADGDHGRERKLLEAVLGRLGNPGVDLIVLRNDVEVHPILKTNAEGMAKLIDMIKGLPYDGATSLGSLILPKNVADYPGAAEKNSAADYDFFLLFTDGIGNLGSELPMRAEVPVYAMCDDLRANHALLRSICQESGGSYFNLNRATDEQVLAGVGDLPLSLVSVECKPDEIADVYPPVGTEVGGRFTLSGKLLVPEAKLTLHYGYGRNVIASQTFTINGAEAKEGSLLPRFWAQQKVAALALFPEKNAEELTKIGRQFNLVTPNTSLLVLETVEQYVQYRVVPPPSRPEIYKEFLAKIEEHHAQVAQSQEQKMQQVVALWNARVQWWEQEHKYPANLKLNPEGGKGGEVVANLAPGVAPATQPGEITEGPGAAGTGHRNPVFGSNGRSPHDAPTISPPRPNAPSGAAQAQGGHANDPAPAADLTAGVAPHSPVARARGVDGQGGGEGDLRARHGQELQSEAEARLDPQFMLQGEKGRKDMEGAREQDGVPAKLAVTIKPWDPNTPYIAAMKAVAPEKAYEVYLAQRKGYARSPAFYFDCADYLVSVGQRKLGIRVLTDIVELELHDARLLRVAAHRLNQIGERELAIDLFEKVLKLRPEEPQSYRDLALTLADRGDMLASRPAGNTVGSKPAPEDIDSALSDYMRSLELLNKVVQGDWPRFPEVELPVLMEANAIAAKAQRLPGIHDFHNPIDSRLQKNLDLDVRVVMTWDADQTDIDLWVTEPSGEKCFYAHNRTVIGGLLSHDFTDGYGPEEYCLRKLMNGQYLIQANFFGSRQQELSGPATVQATVITNFGRPNEKREALTIRLKDVKQVIDLGTIRLGK